MADQTVEIKLILRDELSKQLGPITAALERINAVNFSRPTAQTQALASGISFVRRELSSLASLTLGGLIGGGVVAGLVATSKALGDMARQGMQVRYAAEALGVTPQFFERYRDGLTALGEDFGQAESSIKGVLNALQDAKTFGKESSLFKAIEGGFRGSGTRLRRELQQQLAGPEGVEGALKFLITRMETMAPSGQRALMKQLNLSSLALKDLNQVLKQLPERYRLTKEESLALSVANAKFEIQMGNIGRMLGSVVMPGITKVTSALADFLKTESGKKFTAQLKSWSDSIGESVKQWLEGITEEDVGAFTKEVQSLKENFKEANKVIESIGGWKTVLGALVAIELAKWLGGVGRALQLITLIPGVRGLLLALSAGGALAAWAKMQIEKNQYQVDPEGGRARGWTTDDIRRAVEGLEPKTLFERGREWLEEWWRGKAQPQSGEGLPQTPQEQRAALLEEKNQRNLLTDELKTLAYDLGKLNDVTMAGGPEGGKGPSGFQFGSGGSSGSYDPATGLPMLGPAGGPKTGRPFPTLPPEATPLTAIPGTVRPRQTAGLGFASWYGNIPGFRDLQDWGRKGVKEREQGIALGSRETLGQYHYITDPHTGLTHVVKQTDTGPNIRTQKMLDIHAAQLERMGYTAATFPSAKGLWTVAPAGFGQPEQEKQWAGRGGSFEEGGWGGVEPGGISPITEQIANQGGGSINGSATVDIDVSNLGKAPRNGGDLFRPTPLEGHQQMSNVSQSPSNLMSFQ
jgi:hypothetical protein